MCISRGLGVGRLVGRERGDFELVNVFGSRWVYERVRCNANF